MRKPSKIRVGVILGPHGVLGQVKLRSLTENPDSLFSYAPLTDETGARVFEIKRRGDGTDHFIGSIKGVKDRTQAEALKGTALFVDRALLPQEAEGEYYLADLVGLEARDEAGKNIGFVEEVHDYGAGVFLEIKSKAAKVLCFRSRMPLCL
jgi:16S rRNA processing protein RimM